MRSRNVLLIIIGLLVLIVGGVYFFNNKNTDATKKYASSSIVQFHGEQISTDVTKKDASFSVVQFHGEPISNGKKVNFTDFKGVRELYTINMNKGDKINIKYKSNSLKMAVLDSSYKIVKDFKAGSDNDYNLQCAKSGIYHVRIYGNNTSGNFELQFNNNDNVKVEESNFWN